MKKRTGFYPRVQVDTSRVRGGRPGRRGAADRHDPPAGRARPALSAALAPWRKPLAVHDPGKVVLDLAVGAGVGRGLPGRHRAAAGRARRVRAGRLGPDGVPDDRRAWPPTRRRRWPRSTPPGPRPGRGCGRWPATTPPTTASTPRQPLVIDLDATLVTAHSEKERAAPTFKRGFGFHPLWAFVDHGPDGHRGAAGGAAAARATPAPTPPPTTSPSPAQALAQLPGHRPGHRPGRKVLIRTDGAGATHDLPGLADRPAAVLLGRVRPARRHSPTVLAKIPEHGVDTGLRRRRRDPRRRLGRRSSPGCST